MNKLDKDNLLFNYQLSKENRNWDSKDLRTALVAIGILGGFGRLSTHEMPESIHMQLFSSMAQAMIVTTQQESKRVNQALLVDASTGKLIQGRRTVEKNGTIRVDVTPSADSNGPQPLIATLRTFNPDTPSFGFNGSAYVSFLTNGTEELMVMLFGRNYRWAALKSKATPDLTAHISPDFTIENIVRESNDNQNGKPVKEKLDALHGQIAAHYGLRLYESIRTSSGTPTDQFTVVDTARFR